MVQLLGLLPVTWEMQLNGAPSSGSGVGPALAAVENGEKTSG